VSFDKVYPNFAPFSADDSNDELADKITMLVKMNRSKAPTNTVSKGRMLVSCLL
jgi:hypothetical protein